MYSALRSIYGVAEAFNWNAIPRTFPPSFTPRLTYRFLGTSDDSKDGKRRTPSAGHFSSGTEDSKRPDPSSSLDVQSEVKKHEWKPRWPSKGSKQYSPTIARHVLPLLEARPEDPPKPQAEEPHRFKEALTEPVLPDRRDNGRGPPSLRSIFPQWFRKAVLGDPAPRSESSPPGLRRRDATPRDQRSTELLEQELQLIAQRLPHPKPIQNILRILIQGRQVKPAPRHYEALILGNCDPRMGSIESVQSILREMHREEVPVTPAIMFAIVKVLSVHPDSLLRAHVTDLMESRWISIPPATSQFLVVAMIREGQLELAQAEMERLLAKGVAIEDWIFPIFLHALCDRGDFEAILGLCYTLVDRGFAMPRPTLLHLLDHASSAEDIDLTKYIWHMYVESMHIVPDEAVSMAVLRVAAKHSDHKLAESVAIVLESVTTSTLETPSEQSQGPVSNEEPQPGGDAPPIPSPANATNDAAEPAKSATTPGRIEPRPRTIPAEAQSILTSLRNSYSGTPMSRRDHQRGNLFPVFREDMGLSEARFDPRLALRRKHGWWLQHVRKPRKGPRS